MLSDKYKTTIKIQHTDSNIQTTTNFNNDTKTRKMTIEQQQQHTDHTLDFVPDLYFVPEEHRSKELCMAALLADESTSQQDHEQLFGKTPDTDVEENKDVDQVGLPSDDDDNLDSDERIEKESDRFEIVYRLGCNLEDGCLKFDDIPNELETRGLDIDDECECGRKRKYQEYMEQSAGQCDGPFGDLTEYFLAITERISFSREWTARILVDLKKSYLLLKKSFNSERPLTYTQWRHACDMDEIFQRAIEGLRINFTVGRSFGLKNETHG